MDRIPPYRKARACSVMDSIPPAVWIPAAVILWSVLLFPLFLSFSGGADPNPDELTPLDIYELTGVYPHG